MIRIDCFILGYREFCIDESDVQKTADLFLKNGISVRFKGNKFIAGEKKAKKIENILLSHVRYNKSEIKGLGGFLYRNRKRYGIFLALLIVFFLSWLSSDVVWDVRIEGCDSAVSEKIESELSECGFAVGSMWSESDLSTIEVKLLSNSEHVSWININRRGSVAYVTVIEKEVHELPLEKEGYCNIVAKRDAIIEEITVARGIAVVKVGDVVKKGDLLISGIVPAESGGGYCYAEGNVIGRVSDTLEVNVSDKKVIKEVGKQRISEFKINFFSFYVNIFKSYRNLSNECDIIEETNDLKIFGTRIPVSFYKKYYAPYHLLTVKIDKAEMVDEASEIMATSLSERLVDSTLIRISTDGCFSNDGYRMISEIVCLESIGNDLTFEVFEP